MNFLVPLWQDEIEFELSNTKILIKNNPELDDNITIDNSNNIIIKIKKDISSLLDNDCDVLVGEKLFKIPSKELKIIKNQTFLKRSCGMLKINDDDLFDTSNRCDIVFDITLN